MARVVNIINKRQLANSGHRYSEISQRKLLNRIEGGTVDFERNETSGIATVTLNQPEKRNGLSGSMMVKLRDVVTDLQQWTNGRGVILCGAKGDFCSGGDLKLMKSLLDPGAGAKMSDFMQTTMTNLFLLPLVTVAMVQGVALGGGAELAVGCDFRLNTASSKLGFVQSQMGVSPGWGGGARLVQLIGRTKALDLLVSGRVVGPEKCVELGLSQAIVPETSEAATDWLNIRLGETPPAVIQAAKKVVVNASQGELQSLMDGERKVFRGVWGGQAHKKAMKDNIKHTKKSG